MASEEQKAGVGEEVNCCNKHRITFSKEQECDICEKLRGGPPALGGIPALPAKWRAHGTANDREPGVDGEDFRDCANDLQNELDMLAAVPSEPPAKLQFLPITDAERKAYEKEDAALHPPSIPEREVGEGLREALERFSNDLDAMRPTMPRQALEAMDYFRRSLDDILALAAPAPKPAPPAPLTGYELAGCADRAEVIVRREDGTMWAADWDRFAVEVRRAAERGREHGNQAPE